MNSKTLIRLVGIVVFAGLVYFVVSTLVQTKLDKNQQDMNQAIKQMNNPITIPSSPKTEFTTKELVKLFDDNQKTKEAIEHRVVEVTGTITMAESSRHAFKNDGVLIFLDASPDGVTATENIICTFKPADGGRFSVGFLRWLQSVQDGTPIRVKGTIRVIPDDGFKVKFALVRCSLPD